MNKFTIGTCLDMFYLDLESRCSKSTLENYKLRLKYFINFLSLSYEKPYDCYLDDLSVNDLRLYSKSLRSKKKFDNSTNRPSQNVNISATTVRDYCSDLAAFLAWCYRNDYMSKDITKNWKIISREKKEVLPLYQNEVDQIDACWKTKSETSCRNIAMFHLMLDAGLRSGEVVRLRISDVNFDMNFLEIVGSKGNRSRYVKMSFRLKNYLLRYYNFYRAAIKSDSGNFFLMVGTTEPINSNVVKLIFSRLKVKTGISRLKPHLLRHTFASAFVCQGGNLEHLRLLLGHSNLSISENYIHVAHKWESLSPNIYKLEDAFMNHYR